MIVDDHELLRRGIRLACEVGGHAEVVGEAEDGEGALDLCRRLQPDVVILDLVLSGMNGLDVARRLRQEGSPVRILILTGRTDDRTVFECMRAGVDGYLEKTAGVEVIGDAIEIVAGGGRVFTPRHEYAAISQLGRLAREARDRSSPASTLTVRELEILQFIGHGLTVRQVGSRLNVSPRTVESHIGALYRKLGVETRVQALALAASLGLIDLASKGGGLASVREAAR